MLDILFIDLIDEYDVHNLVELEKLCFSDPWTEVMFLGDLKNDNTMYMGAYTNDNMLIGYTGMWKIGDTAEITNIAVHPEYRRNGIASLILKKVIEYCINNDFLYINLEVRESNNAAILFYEKFGFEKVGLRKNYYKNPTENAILMTKTLLEERDD